MKRLYRSLKKEFEKLVRLNRLYLDDPAYFVSYDGQDFIRKEDYDNETLRVFPIADPQMSSDAERMAKAQALMQLPPDPMINRFEIIKRYLETLEISQIDKIITPPDPNAPPPPEVLKTEAETKLLNTKAAGIMMDADLEALRLEQSDQDRQGRMAEGAARVLDMGVKSVERFAKLEQEGAHFAIEQAMQDVAQEEGMTAPSQQINYSPVTADELMARTGAMNQQQQPQQAPQEMPQELPPEILAQLEAEQGGVPQ